MNQAAMDIPEMIRRSKPFGWILEPEAKKLLQSYSIPTTNFVWIKERESITEAMAALSYPVVCKVVSPLILHKTAKGEFRYHHQGTVLRFYRFHPHFSPPVSFKHHLLFHHFKGNPAFSKQNA